MGVKRKFGNIINHPVLKNNILYSGTSYFFRIFNSLILFSLAARIFSVEDFGLISIFMLIVMVIYTAIDFGHRILIVKEISKDSSKVNNEYIGNKVWVKLILFLFISAIVLIYAIKKEFWGYGVDLIITMLIAGFARGITNLYFAIFQGLELFINESKSLGLFSFMIGIVIWICSYSPSIPIFIYGFTIASILQLLVTHYFATRDIPNFSIKTVVKKCDFKALGKELRIGLVFALIVFVEIGFSSFDSFFVENQYTRLDLGHYEGFKKLYTGLNILGMVFSVAIFPAISKRLIKRSTENIVFIFSLYAIMTIIGTILFLIYFPLNGTIINIILGSNFEKLTTWDFHIALITIASYMRIVPNLYFVSSGNEKIRFLGTALFLIVEVISFTIILDGSTDVRHAIKLLTKVHLYFTAFLSFAFFLYNYFDYKKIISTRSKSINQ